MQILAVMQQQQQLAFWNVRLLLPITWVIAIKDSKETGDAVFLVLSRNQEPGAKNVS